MYFISFATVNWIDVFTRNEYKDILIESWKFCQYNKGLEIYGWCIMPGHVHMIIGSNKNKLEDIVRDMKSFTSTKLREVISNHPQESRKEWMKWMMERASKNNVNNNEWQFWKQNNMPLEITGKKQFLELLQYIHMNPVAAGFVYAPENWMYSSSNGYEKNNGLIVRTELE